MIDLRAFYFDNIDDNSYHSRFSPIIEQGNLVYDFSDGAWHKDGNIRFKIFDEQEAIERFRKLCDPNISFADKQNTCWFYLIAYFLDINGYHIEEFPDVLSRPPEDPSDFTYGKIRKRAFSLGLAEGNQVSYSVRRDIVGKMHFVHSKASSSLVDSNLDRRVQIISTRNAHFDEMETDEKLKEIVNLLENLLKRDGGFVNLDYSSATFGYVTNETVKDFRKRCQCFRHASDGDLAQRATFTSEQKAFLVDYGITLCKVVSRIVSKDDIN